MRSQSRQFCLYSVYFNLRTSVHLNGEYQDRIFKSIKYRARINIFYLAGKLFDICIMFLPKNINPKLTETHDNFGFMLRCFFLFDMVSFLPFLYWFPSTRQWLVSENIAFIFCIVHMTLRRCNRNDCNRYDWEYNWQWGYIVKSYQARMILKTKKQNKSLIPPNGILLLPLTSIKLHFWGSA